LLGRSVSLWPLPPQSEPIVEFTSARGTFFDAFPIHVLTTSSLEAMKRLNRGAIWDVRRFRPNFFVETDAGIEGLIDSEWPGQNLRIGAVELRCEAPTERCGMATHAQKDLPKDASILRSLVEEADQNLGVYASVVKAGDVRVGDVVEAD
jgi:uncharacterized protein YcbX